MATVRFCCLLFVAVVAKLDESTVTKLDALGPIVVGKDGSLSRIPNWSELTETEKAAAMRMIPARNEKRRRLLQEAEEKERRGGKIWRAVKRIWPTRWWPRPKTRTASIAEGAPVTNKRTIPARMASLQVERRTWEAGKSKFYKWLDATQEEALEPELEIVEAHHHMWDKRVLNGANAKGLENQQYYMADEVVDDLVGSGHNVTHSVFVTAGAFFTADAQPPWMAPLGEVQFAQGIAAQFASGAYGPIRVGAAIIGIADLANQGADIEPLLVASKVASPNYRGIKITCSHDAQTALKFYPKAHMFAQPKFREGFALLEKHDLLFEAWMFSSQLRDLYDLAKAFPTTTIVLCHAGTQVAGFGNVTGAEVYDGKQAEVIARWKEGLEAIAKECPNVIIKIGGWGLPFLGTGFSTREKPPTSKEVADVFRETFLYTVKTFGAARCMLESDFPVCKVGLSYTVRRARGRLAGEDAMPHLACGRDTFAWPVIRDCSLTTLDRLCIGTMECIQNIV